MEPLSLTSVALRLGAALALGALVGIERERKQRPAGFRTMILISLGTAGFVLVGLESLRQFPNTGQAEISRIMQGLVGGIGFLGAGSVIQSKRAVRGLTTAAAVWVTAAIGAACGLGLFSLAGMLAFAALFTLVVLELVENRYFPDPEDWDEPKKSKESGDAGQGPALLRGEQNDPNGNKGSGQAPRSDR